MLLAAVSPAQAQWNYYSNGESFFVPMSTNSTTGNFEVSLTLNYNNSQKTSSFVVDTGSLGIMAGTNAYSPGPNDISLGPGLISYNSDSNTRYGTLYLTTVTINGQNGQTATARVPILAATGDNGVGAQMGVGFDRGGLQFGTTVGHTTPVSATYNLNPFLGLLTINGQPVTAMNPGYIISTTGFQANGQPTGAGIMLGLTGANTSGFSFVQLTPTGVPLPSGCTTTGMGCPGNWNSQLANIVVGGQNLGTLNMLPDSGIGFMILSVPNGGIPTVPGECGARGKHVRCLASGVQVQVYLPGQSPSQAANYSFIVDANTGNVLQPSPGVQVVQADTVSPVPNVNTGRNFFNGFDYLYDPVGGFIGYRLNGQGGSNAVVMPLLALQGNLTLLDGFSASFPTFLMGTSTIQQNGSGTFNAPIFGPGGLTLNGGTLTLAAANGYTGGTTVNGGTLNLAGSIVGDLTVGPGGTFINSGTVQSPGYWLLNQGTLTNSGTIAGNLANVGMATNSGTLNGSLINGISGSFTNNGTVTGDVINIGVLSGSGSIGGSLASSGMLAPGNSIGTLSVSGNFAQAAGGVYATEVAGAGLSDRINVGGVANLGGSVTVTALPGMVFAPSTTYTILSAAGGLNGTFSSVNELYPFLLSSLSYDANNAYLTLQIGGFAAAAATPTQAAVGAALDASVANAAGDFATVLGAMAFNTLSDGQAQATLQALSGNNYAGFSSFMVQNALLFMNNFANQSRGGGGPASSRVALAEACDVACDSTAPALWGAWGGGLGGLGTIGASAPVGGVTYNVGGFAAGLDRLVAPNLRVGVTAGYTSGTQWVSGFNGKGVSDTVQAGLYGNYAQDRVYADAVAGYAYSYNQMWRSLQIPGLQPRTALGQTGANQFFGQLETGYRFDLGTNADAYVTPFARLQGYVGAQNGFTETGAQSVNLTVAAQTTSSLRTVLGAQLGGAMDLGWREKLAVQLRLGWSHEYADTSRPVTAAFTGAPAASFTTYGVAPQRDGAVVGVAANTAIAEATSLYLRYEGNIAGQDSAHALTAGVRMTW